MRAVVLAAFNGEEFDLGSAWVDQFRRRIRDFGAPMPGDGCAISIKVRVTSGCFHREHSPRAYAIIDDYMASREWGATRIEEHESGPELLLWLAAGTATITLTKSVIDLVTAIIKARSDGIRQGDRPADPLELIVRNVGPDGRVTEERVLRIHRNDNVDAVAVGTALNQAASRLLQPSASEDSAPDRSAKNPTAKAATTKREAPKRGKTKKTAKTIKRTTKPTAKKAKSKKRTR